MKKIFCLITGVILMVSLTGCFSVLRHLSERNKEEPNVAKVYGEWATQAGALFTIGEDGTCGWYKDKDNREDFYYTGEKTEILQGNDALEELGITKEEQANSEFYNDPEAVFSVKMHYSYLISDGVDKSDTLTEESYNWLMIKIVDDNNAIGVNIATASTYELERVG